VPINAPVYAGIGAEIFTLGVAGSIPVRGTNTLLQLIITREVIMEYEKENFNRDFNEIRKTLSEGVKLTDDLQWVRERVNFNSGVDAAQSDKVHLKEIVNNGVKTSLIEWYLRLGSQIENL
jgi:hypothetical protein